MGGAGELCVETGAGSRKLFVRISDSGPGVPVELREEIFAPFFSTKERGVGTGLGLSVCRKLVEAHGGTLTLADSPLGGATFRLEFPAAPDQKRL